MGIEFPNIEAAQGGLALTPVQAFLDHELITSVTHKMTAPVWVFDIDRCTMVWANASALHMWRAESLAEFRTRDFASSMSVTVAKKLRQYSSLSSFAEPPL